jgi:hypothetical protein
MDPLILYFVIFGLIILGGITLYETVFGGKSDVSERLSTGPDAVRGFKIDGSQFHVDRLLQWNIRRLRETRSRSASPQELPKTLTFAGFRGIESVARVQLIRLAITGGTGLAGGLVCLWAGQQPMIGVMAGFAVAISFPGSSFPGLPVPASDA